MDRSYGRGITGGHGFLWDSLGTFARLAGIRGPGSLGGGSYPTMGMLRCKLGHHFETSLKEVQHESK